MEQKQTNKMEKVAVIHEPGVVYKVVKGMGKANVAKFDTKEELVAVYTQVDICKNLRVREELQGQPILVDLLGPMWDGRDEGGNAVIRYESQEVYDMLSN